MAAHTSVFDDLASLEPITSPITPTTPTPQRKNDAAQSANIPHTVLSKDTDKLHSQPPTSAVDNEQNFNLFSTLFSPSTPHASPTHNPTQLPPEEPRRKAPSLPPIHYRSGSMSSQNSDFGAFVSVSSFDDPLSANFGDFDQGSQEPNEAANVDEHVTSDPTSSNISKSSDPQKKLNVLTRTNSRASSSTRSTSHSLQHDGTSGPSNPTLSYFDQFAQDAKERSTKRRSVLNELLMHEDDPLYFLKETGPPETPSTATPFSPKLHPPPPKSPLVATEVDPPAVIPVSSSTPAHNVQSVQASSSTTTLKPSSPPISSTEPSGMTPTNSLVTMTPDFDFTNDVDHHYFRLPSSTPPTSSVLRPTPYSPPQSHTTTANQGSRPQPIRAPSISVADPRPASPITSVRIAAGSPGQSASSSPAISFASSDGLDHSRDKLGHNHDPDHISPEDRHKKLTRTPSYSALSGSISALSGKWMPTFLRGAGSPGTSPNAAHGGARPTLESIFQDSHNHHEPHHAQTLPNPSTTSASPSNTLSHRQIQPTFTHSNVFAASPSSSSISGLPSTSSSSIYSTTLSHNPSPFAPHVYVPPSGAPGYTGEGYGAGGWDKGYSDELEREMRNGSSKSGLPEPPHTQPRSKTLPEPAGSTSTTREREHSGGSGKWGSGFGFGFGSVRGRSEMNPDTSTVPSRTAALADRPSNTTVSGHVDGYRTMDGNGRGGGDLKGVGNGGLGAFIEKKVGNVELLGRKEYTTPVLAPEQAATFRPYLPPLARLPKAWTLIYSLDQNGISLNTLYSRCEAHASRRPAPGEMINTSMLIAVKDAEGAVFGVWLAEGITNGKSGRGYFGGGESFLWKCGPKNDLQIFKCTNKNNYVALCEPGYISFGGGDGRYGLYLDDTLFEGSSAPCPTFDNVPLCSPGPKRGSTVAFECVGLEVWGMGP